MPVEVERQVAVILYYMSDEGHLHKTANSFGLSRSLVSIIIQRVTHVIGVHLGPKYITVPLTEDAVMNKVTRFFSAFCIPHCLGAIDGAHIEIKQQFCCIPQIISTGKAATHSCSMFKLAVTISTTSWML